MKFEINTSLTEHMMLKSIMERANRDVASMDMKETVQRVFEYGLFMVFTELMSEEDEKEGKE